MTPWPDMIRNSDCRSGASAANVDMTNEDKKKRRCEDIFMVKSRKASINDQ